MQYVIDEVSGARVPAPTPDTRTELETSLLNAAKAVIRSWDRGDLAQAVRELAFVVRQAEEGR